MPAFTKDSLDPLQSRKLPHTRLLHQPCPHELFRHFPKAQTREPAAIFAARRLYVRVFTGFYEDEVAGMVLVDPVVEDFHEPDGRSEPTRRALLAIGEVIGRLGFFRLMEPVPDPPKGRMTREDWATLINLLYRFENQQANLKSKPVRPSAEQARASGGLDNLPLVVLSAGEGNDFGYSPITFWASEEEDPREAGHGFHVELRKKLAARSRFGKHTVVGGSGHGITYDAPDAVIDAIRDVVAQSRMMTGTPGSR